MAAVSGDRRLRVLLAITRLELGGAQRVVLETAAGLDRRRFVVGLAWGPGDALDPEAREIPELERFEIPALVRPIAPGRDLAAMAGLRRAIRSFAPDVVHTHSSKAGILGRLAARLEATPAVVHTIHGFGFTPLQRPLVRALYRLAERTAARWTDHVVAVSAVQRERGAACGLYPLERSSVIRAAVPLARFRAGDGARARRRLGLPGDVPVVTQVGNFKPQKGPLDFVRAAAAVAARVPQARFVMVGEGPLRPAAEVLADELGIADRVLFPGWWDDVPGLLAATRVAVLTSYHEGLPCAVVEALAAGVPVVATAVDGTVEVVRDGDNGFLAPAGRPEIVAEKVVALLEDEILWRRCAAAAAVGLDDFDLPRMIGQQEELYRWLCGGTRS